MNVDQLNGAMLDFWVAKAEGLKSPQIEMAGGIDTRNHPVCQYIHHHEEGDDGWFTEFSPSTDPAQAYLIIEREKIQTFYQRWHGYSSMKPCWYGSIEVLPDEDHLAAGVSNAEPKRTSCHGATVLEAAMRAYVTLRFGHAVEDLA